MSEAIPLMESMFHDLATGQILQPLRTLMWLPDKKGLLGMMPAYAKTPEAQRTADKATETNAGIIGIKLITIFHGNADTTHPSHQGVIILFNGDNGAPLMLSSTPKRSPRSAPPPPAPSPPTSSPQRKPPPSPSSEPANRQQDISNRSPSSAP